MVSTTIRCTILSTPLWNIQACNENTSLKSLLKLALKIFIIVKLTWRDELAIRREY